VIAIAGACQFHPGGSTTDASGVGDGPDAPLDALVATKPCEPLAMPPNTVVVTDEPSLRTAVTNATAGDTIALADGTYDLSSTGALTFNVAGVTLRSMSGNAAGVTLDGGGIQSPLITIHASNVVIASITLAHALNITVHIEPKIAADITGDEIYDVTFADNGGAGLRLRPFNNAAGATGPYADNGTIACSRFVDTAAVDHCTPNILAIDGIAIRGWTIRNNRFDGVTCPIAPRRTIWLRNGSRDTQIVSNVFVGSSMNIMMGDSFAAGGRSYVDMPPAACGGSVEEWGGLVCNNVIDGLGVPAMISNTDFEEGIGLWTSCDTWVMHNTIVSPAAPETFHDIEYRFVGTYVHLVNNLTLQAPALRDLGMQDPAFTASNVTYAGISDFVDAINADLHLSATAAVGSGTSIAGLARCTTDADGKPRALDKPTPGAFEF
jgi:hypothetical protein